MMTFGLLSAALETLLVGALAFVLLTLVASFLRFQFLTADSSPGSDEEVERGSSFLLQIARRLGSAHRTPDPFAVMLLRPRDCQEEVDAHSTTDADRVMDAIRSRLRAHRDWIGSYEEGAVGAVIEGR